MTEVTESRGQLRGKNRTAGGIPDTEARRKITPKLYRRSIGSVCAGIPTVIPEADTVLCPSNRYAGGYTAFFGSVPDTDGVFFVAGTESTGTYPFRAILSPGEVIAFFFLFPCT